MVRFTDTCRPPARRVRQQRSAAALSTLLFSGWAAAGCSSGEGTGADRAGAERAGESSETLSIATQTPIGDVVAHAAPELARDSGVPGGGWSLVPGLSGVIQTAAGANIAATVTAEMLGMDSAVLRARMDGALGSSTVVFAGQPRDDVRSFTFVFPNVAAGQHTIEIEWSTCQSCPAGPRMGDRTLTLHAAQPGGQQGLLAVSQGTGAFFVDAAFGPVPGLSTTITSPSPGPLAITFSADTLVTADELAVQAVVDGTVVEQATIQANDADEWVRRASRSYTFVTPSVAAGTHSVELRAATSDVPDTAVLFGRTVTVASAPASSAGGGMVATRAASSALITSSSWVDVPGLSVQLTTSAAASTAIVETGGEAGVNDGDSSTTGRDESGRMLLRALVDGRPARPGDVLFVQGSPALKAQSFAFAIDNLAPGPHTVQIQAVVSPGATGSFGQRYLRVHHARRSGAAFAAPYRGMQPKHRPGLETLVVCFDPLRPGHSRPSKAQLQAMFEGGYPSLKGWWAENAGPRMTSGAVSYIGCEDGGWFNPPPERQGNYYWDNRNWHLMWEEALRAADASFDFHARDRNGSGQLEPDELLVAVVRPQDVPDGTARSTTVALDGQSSPLTMPILDAYLSPSAERHAASVGVMAHELSHIINRAVDLYEPCPVTHDADIFSVMSNHRSATHLDPWHKLKSGFVTPDALEIGSLTGRRDLGLRAVERGEREVLVLYDRDRADREYFVLENRWRTGTYDRTLPSDGVVVWHVIEDQALRQAKPFPDERPCRIPARFIRSLEFIDAALDLRWADGTAAPIRVSLRLMGETSSIRVEKIACVPAPIATTCAGKQCGPAVDNCGNAVTCPNTCSTPEACGFLVGQNACGCISNGNPCPSTQCRGTAVDNCGTVFQCRASCGTSGVCPGNGGTCIGSSCVCHPGPAF